MTAEWKYLIYLYGCGATGTAAQAPQEKIDWQALLQLANRQAASAVVSCALRSAPFCPEPIRMQCRQTALAQAVYNQQQSEAVLQTLSELESRGLHPVVLKGYDLARLYAIVECRSSADTDLLFPEKEEAEVYKALSEMGFTVTPRKRGVHHGKASCCRSMCGKTSRSRHTARECSMSP